MIIVFARLSYRRQLRATLPELPEEIEAAFRKVAREMGASFHSTEESLLLAFSEPAGCAELRATESLRKIGRIFARLAPGLHGWVLVIDRTEEEPQDAVIDFERLWLRIDEDGIFATAAVTESFREYLECGQGGEAVPVLAFKVAAPVVPQGWSTPGPDASALVGMADELRQQRAAGGTRKILVVTGPDDVVSPLVNAAIREAGPRDAPPYVIAALPGRTPLHPFISGIPPAESDTTPAARAARFVETSPFREVISPAIFADFSRAIRERLFTLRKPEDPEGSGEASIVLIENLDAFPTESLRLLETAIGDGSSEGPDGTMPMLVAIGRESQSGFSGIGTKTLKVSPPRPSELADAAREGALALGQPSLAPLLASTARGEWFRLRLAMRLARDDSPVTRARLEGGSISTKDLIIATLHSWPREFAAFLRVISLADDVLDDSAYEAFLDATGFKPGIRPIILSALETLGLIEEGTRPRIARREVEEAIASHELDLLDIDRAFLAQLLSLYRKKQIIPSIALHERLSEIGFPDANHATFLLDCIAADEAFGPSKADEPRLDPPHFAVYLPLVKAMALPDGEGVSEAIAAFAKAVADAGSPTLETAILILSRSTYDYSRGESAAAATSVRQALMTLHKLGAHRTEARAHRLLGLCSLAARQVQEGCDYLTNAAEMADQVPDYLESFFAALSAAGASFTLGDLRRAMTWQERARVMASRAFRPDWELGSSFLAGRLAFELGQYGDAGEHFRKVAVSAQDLGNAEARLRAEVWIGRSAAYDGYRERAADILSARVDDAEAAWFLAESVAWNGHWNEAARLAESVPSLIQERKFHPIDLLSWASGFDFIEGPCMGFGSRSPYLADQAAVFASYARAMASGDPASLHEITSRTRERRLATIHPQAHLYDFYAFTWCESVENPPSDPGTLLSRAWKSLQIRTMHLEEAGMKNQYLEANRWNREIVAAARARRLI
jgi:tetratricopeptide (TPR) repeat protein